MLYSFTVIYPSDMFRFILIFCYYLFRYCFSTIFFFFYDLSYADAGAIYSSHYSFELLYHIWWHSRWFPNHIFNLVVYYLSESNLVCIPQNASLISVTKLLILKNFMFPQLGSVPSIKIVFDPYLSSSWLLIKGIPNSMSLSTFL